MFSWKLYKVFRVATFKNSHELLFCNDLLLKNVSSRLRKKTWKVYFKIIFSTRFVLILDSMNCYELTINLFIDHIQVLISFSSFIENIRVFTKNSRTKIHFFKILFKWWNNFFINWSVFRALVWFKLGLFVHFSSYFIYLAKCLYHKYWLG